VLDETFAVNLASGKAVDTDQHRLRHPKFAPANIVDDDPDSYWAADDGVSEATLEIDLGREAEFDRIMLQEPIRFGQRISAFEIQARIEGNWVRIAGGTTIGYKRLFRIPAVSTDRVRIVVKQSNNVPALSNFGLFKAPAGETEE